MVKHMAGRFKIQMHLLAGPTNKNKKLGNKGHLPPTHFHVHDLVLFSSEEVLISFNAVCVKDTYEEFNSRESVHVFHHL